MKNQENFNCLEAPGLKILLAVMVLYGLFSMPFLSAFEFDNIKEVPNNFDIYKNKITIKNSFLGLYPLGKVADIKLLENTDQALIEGRAIFEMILYEDYTSPISRVNFYDDSNKKVNNVKGINWYYWDDSSYEENIPIYETICSINKDIKNTSQICENKIVSYKKETKYNSQWVLYDPDKKFKIGTYKFKLIANKPINKKVDFIPTLFGIELPEFVWWNSDWKKRQVINITGGTEAMINFTVLVNITYNISMQTDFEDIRFINGICTGTQDIELDYEWDKVVASNSALVWVRIPALNSGINQICMYYNNSAAADGSDRENTWDKDYMAIYHLSEGTGSNINDSIGSGNGYGNGTVIGSPTWTGGRIGGALLFNQSSYIRLDPQSRILEIIGGGSYHQVSHEAYGNYLNVLTSETPLLGWAEGGTDPGIWGLWIKGDNTGDPVEFAAPGIDRIVSQFNTTNNNWYYMSSTLNKSNGGLLDFVVDNDTQHTTNGLLVAFNFGAGHNVTLGWTGSPDNRAFNGTIDEYRVSNTSRSVAWLNRSGQNFDASLFSFGDELNITGISVALSYPIDSFSTYDNTLNLSCNSTIETANLTNVTYKVYNSDGNLVLNQVQFITGKLNSTIQNLTNYPFTQYNWSCIAFADDLTKANTINRTINITYYFENNRTFNANVLTGSTENFKINLNYSSSYWNSIIASLIYNNTGYPATKIGSGDNILFSKDLAIPSISAISQFNFTWQLGFVNSTTTNYINTTNSSQLISIMGVGGCGTSFNVTILNFTMYDEENQTRINGTSDNGIIELDLQGYPEGSTNPIFNYTIITTNSSNLIVCGSNATINSTNYRFYSQLKYSANGYVPEYHYLQNYSFYGKTIPQEISLYDLLFGDSTEFLMTFKDSTLLPTENAIINILRKYVSEGTYKSVEMAKTDSYGQAKGHFDTNNVDYKLIITKNGEILATFDNIAIYCEDRIIGDCQISLYQSESITDATDFYTYKNIFYSTNFNSTTRKVTMNYQIIDGSSSKVSLNLTKFDNYGNTTVCSTQITSPSGTIDCTIPASYQNITVLSKIYSDGDLVAGEYYSIAIDKTDIFGNNYVFFIVLFVLLIPLMMIPSPAGVVFGVFLGTLLGMFLLFMNPTIISSTSFLMWMIIAVLIIIWKIQSRSAE